MSVRSEVVVEPLVGVAADFAEVPCSPAALEVLVPEVHSGLALVLFEERMMQAAMLARLEVRLAEEVVTFARVEELEMVVRYEDFPSRSEAD